MTLKMVANSVGCGLTEVELYKAPSNTTVQIVRLTVVNNGPGSTWFSVFIHSSAGLSQPIINHRLLPRTKSSNCIEVIAHEVMPGARITAVSGGLVNATLTVDQ